MDPGALVGEQVAPTERDIHKGAHSPRLGFVEVCRKRRERFAGGALQALAQRSDISLPGGKFGFERGGSTGQPLGQLQHPRPRFHRGKFLTRSLEQLGHPQLGREIDPVDRQRPVERRALARKLAGQAIRMGKVAPQRPGRWIERRGSGKCPDRIGAVPAAQRGEPLRIGSASGLRIGGGHRDAISRTWWTGKHCEHCTARLGPCR